MLLVGHGSIGCKNIKVIIFFFFTLFFNNEDSSTKQTVRCLCNFKFFSVETLTWFFKSADKAVLLQITPIGIQLYDAQTHMMDKLGQIFRDSCTFLTRTGFSLGRPSCGSM